MVIYYKVKKDRSPELYNQIRQIYKLKKTLIIHLVNQLKSIK